MVKVNIHNVVKLSEFSDWVAENYSMSNRIVYQVIIEKLKLKYIRIFYLKDVINSNKQEFNWIEGFLNHFNLDNIAFYLDLEEKKYE